MTDPVYKTKYDHKNGGYAVVGDRENVPIFRGDFPACEDFAYMMNFGRAMRTPAPVVQNPEVQAEANQVVESTR